MTDGAPAAPARLEERATAQHPSIGHPGKRAMDILGAGLLLVLSAPVIAVGAAAVALTSPGPLLHRRRVVGRGGTEFDALKLVKRRDHPEDRVTEIWLAADRGYLPVRVLLVEKDGARIDTLAAKIVVQ